MRTLLALLGGLLGVAFMVAVLSTLSGRFGPTELALAGFIGFPLGFCGVYGSATVEHLTSGVRQRTGTAAPQRAHRVV